MIDLPIVRLFQTPEQASRAHEALRRWGFEPERIAIVSRPAGTAAAPSSPAGPSAFAAGNGTLDEATLEEAIHAARIPASHAHRYAEAVRRGYTLVSVMAPFGTGGIAEELLGDEAPVAFDVAPFVAPLLPSDLAAPLSRTLGLPTVSHRGRTTSEILGLPAISGRSRTTSEALGIPAVARSGQFTFGTPRVGGAAAPFSRLFGLPVLTRRGRTTGEATGVPEVARRDAFTFGNPRLSDAAAPFSSLLGLPVLIRD